MGVIKSGQEAIVVFDTENQKHEINCVVKNIYKDRISLTPPKGYMEFVNFLREGQEIEVKLISAGGLEVFSSIIINSPLEAEFVVEYIDETVEIQRRQFPRVKAKEKIIVLKIYGEEDKETHTIDIGGGGIRFYSDEFIEPGQIMDFKAYLPFQEDPITFSGEIMDNSNLPKDNYVVIFTDIEVEDRNKILKACFRFEATIYNRK